MTKLYLHTITRPHYTVEFWIREQNNTYSVVMGLDFREDKLVLRHVGIVDPAKTIEEVEVDLDNMIDQHDAFWAEDDWITAGRLGIFCDQIRDHRGLELGMEWVEDEVNGNF